MEQGNTMAPGAAIRGPPMTLRQTRLDEMFQRP